MIATEQLRLVPFTAAHYKAIFEEDNVALGKLLHIDTPQSWSEFEAAKEAIHELHKIFLSLNGDLRWGSYFITLQNGNELIGTCGFKGKPNSEEEVEIGYEINTKHQGKGIATLTVKALTDFAFMQSIQAVKAHTLAEENASVKVLKKCGFTFTGEINDPEDGLIWGWVLHKK